MAEPRSTSEAKPDAWEESARIVEAFASGQDEETAALLAQVAGAIRDHATDT